MASIASYRNELAYSFCYGCTHRHILDVLDRALVRQQWDPAQIVIVTDIGCVGLSDQYFTTCAFHGLHGRSLTYATGIKLARPNLHVVVLIGDGGCGIGATHLLSAARRNIGITCLVFNNLNFGMTGGEHSATSLTDLKTVTTPKGNIERPMDIAETAAINGATYIWRGTAYEPDFEQRVSDALSHDGFALLDIWELCVAHVAAMNKLTPAKLEMAMEVIGFRRGLFTLAQRPEFTKLQRAVLSHSTPEPKDSVDPMDVMFTSPLDHKLALVIAGSAGGRVRTTGRLLGAAATLSGLWVTQRDDYPVTVRSGHSVTEIIISPEEIHYTGVDHPHALFVLSGEGYAKVAHYIPSMLDDHWLFVTPEFAEIPTAARKIVLDPRCFTGIPHTCYSMAYIAAGVARMGILFPESILRAAQVINKTYSDINTRAVLSGFHSFDC
ncbi:MAG: thiamine pyrophosphate-dependent enzyme [Anaerolineae bacterium]|nr:thiamine pyrophosphate-dependent enzyme [Anaerolineae bacterium]